MARADLVHLEVKGKPFAEAVAFIRAKAAIPTERWDDMLGQYHARAFTVAGAMRDDLLTDFYTSIDKAISSGTTLAQFRKEFDAIVARHGWSYNGNRNWRSRLIYNVNIQTAYQAGRYDQLQAIKDIAPFWEYSSRKDDRVRPQHREWDGLVLSADDPWWNTHYPPNGWLCRCRVWPRSKKDLERMGRTGPDKAPEIVMQEHVISKTGEMVKAPVGIDPGWDYNVGKAGFGEKVSEEAWKAAKGKRVTLTPGDYKIYNRPAMIPVDRTNNKAGRRVKDRTELAAAVRSVLGGDEKVLRHKNGQGFAYSVLVNANTLANHIDIDRAPFLPFLVEVLEDPYEIWMAFEQDTATGKVYLRQRYIKVIEQQKDTPLLLVADAEKGRMTAWTYFRPGNLKYLNKQRVGKLVWSRE